MAQDLVAGRQIHHFNHVAHPTPGQGASFGKNGQTVGRVRQRDDLVAINNRLAFQIFGTDRLAWVNDCAGFVANCGVKR